MTKINKFSITYETIITKEKKYKGEIDEPHVLFGIQSSSGNLIVSYIMTFHSSPVAILRRIIIAVPKFSKDI